MSDNVYSKSLHYLFDSTMTSGDAEDAKADLEAFGSSRYSTALRWAAEFIVSETDMSTGNPALNPNWREAQKHAKELARLLRNEATGVEREARLG